MQTNGVLLVLLREGIADVQVSQQRVVGGRGKAIPQRIEAASFADVEASRPKGVLNEDDSARRPVFTSNLSEIDPPHLAL